MLCNCSSDSVKAGHYSLRGWRGCIRDDVRTAAANRKIHKHVRWPYFFPPAHTNFFLVGFNDSTCSTTEGLKGTINCSGDSPSNLKGNKKTHLQYVLFMVHACGLSIKARHVVCVLRLFQEKTIKSVGLCFRFFSVFGCADCKCLDCLCCQPPDAVTFSSSTVVSGFTLRRRSSWWLACVWPLESWRTCSHYVLFVLWGRLHNVSHLLHSMKLKKYIFLFNIF